MGSRNMKKVIVLILVKALQVGKSVQSQICSVRSDGGPDQTANFIIVTALLDGLGQIMIINGTVYLLQDVTS